MLLSSPIAFSALDPITKVVNKPRMAVSRLTELRKRKGLSQRQVAEIVGVSWQTVSGWERNRIPSKRVPGLAELFEVDPSEMFSGRPLQRAVKVVAVAEADLWIGDPKIANADQPTVLISEDAAIADVPLKAAAVAGDHAADRYPDDLTVFFTPLWADGHAVREGPRYVVQRQRPDGTAEISIRRLVRDEAGGRWWIAGHPAVAGFPEHGGGTETVIVLGRIVRAHVKEA